MNDKHLAIFPDDGRPVLHEARALLKAAGFDHDEVDAASPKKLSLLFIESSNRRHARIMVRDMIESGALDESAARQMTSQELEDLAYLSMSVGTHRDVLSSDAGRAFKAPVVMAPDQVTRSEMVAVLSEATAVIAALAERVSHLEGELAATRNANIAAFGKHEIIEQLTKAERDIEGFEVTMTLESKAEESTSRARTEASSVATAVDGVTDLHAAIEGLAAHVVGLDVGRTVDTKKLERRVRRLSEQSRRETRMSTKGHVHLKVGKLSGASPKKENQ